MHEDFFAEIDASWRWPQPARIELHIIGSAALMMQVDYQRQTKDSDVFETVGLAKEVRAQLETLAGKGTALHVRRRLYLDVVPNGLPFFAHVVAWKELTRCNANLRHFHLRALNVVDVVVSKLKRFSANDRRDVEAMIALGHVPHERLVERFRAAVDCFAYDARADDLPKIVENLHTVERDFMNVPESEIELLSWV